MIRFGRFRPLWGLLAAPLALGLAACGDSDTSDSGLSGDPIARVAPPEGQAWSEVIGKTPEGGYRMGNPDAPIKLVEFGALSCSHCAHFAEESGEELFNDFVDSGRVSFELRYFMLNSLDVTATLLATCGSTEAAIPLSEQFWAWQPTMFENLQKADQAKLQAIDAMSPQQRFVSFAEVSGMTAFFSSRGIAEDQAAACLSDSGKVQALVDATEKASKDFDITGTPTFLINGRKADVNAWPQIKADLEKLGAR